MRGSSIVEQAVDPVDVLVDRDRQQAFVRTDSRSATSATVTPALRVAAQAGERQDTAIRHTRFQQASSKSATQRLIRVFKQNTLRCIMFTHSCQPAAESEFAKSRFSVHQRVGLAFEPLEAFAALAFRNRLAQITATNNVALMTQRVMFTTPRADDLDGVAV